MLDTETVYCYLKWFKFFQGSKTNIEKRARCMFCYQTELWEQTCHKKSSCVAVQVFSHYFKYALISFNQYPNKICFEEKVINPLKKYHCDVRICTIILKRLMLKKLVMVKMTCSENYVTCFFSLRL